MQPRSASAPAPHEWASRGGAETPERAQRLLEIGYALAATAIVLQSVAHVVVVRALDGRIWSLDADAEGNAVTWAGSAATFAAAVVAFVLAIVPEKVDRRLLVLAALAAAFSLDDAIEVHERLAERGADALGLSLGAGRVIWPAVYLPALAAALLLLRDTSRRIFDGAARMLRRGLLWLVVAVAAELVSAFLDVVLDVERGSWPDAIEVAIEESAELGGWILVACALAAALLVALVTADDRS